MGLELNSARLKSLAKYAFGLGSLQVLATTVAFTAIALPVGSSVGTQLLETFFKAPHQLVTIRSLDEALVIGAALSLSSSAFVLSILKGEGGQVRGAGLASAPASELLLPLLPCRARGAVDKVRGCHAGHPADAGHCRGAPAGPAAAGREHGRPRGTALHLAQVFSAAGRRFPSQLVLPLHAGPSVLPSSRRPPPLSLQNTAEQGMMLLSQLGPSAAKALGILGSVILTGRLLLRQVFELVVRPSRISSTRRRTVKHEPHIRASSCIGVHALPFPFGV